MWPCFCPRTVPPGPADFYLRPVDLHPQLALPELHPCLTPHIPGVNTISNLLTDGQWQVFSGLSGFLLLFFSSCLTFPHVYKVSSCFVRFSSCFVRVSHVTFIIWRSLPMSPWFGLACFRWLSVTVNLVRFPTHFQVGRGTWLSCDRISKSWRWQAPVCLRGHRLDKLNQRQIVEPCLGNQIWN